tara:strand:- start:332 stop:496 length:165 start_codon:yes stop_codon:yes gene_type:complete
MLEILIAQQILTCEDADELIEKARKYKVSEEQRVEFIQVYKDAAPKECFPVDET